MKTNLKSIQNRIDVWHARPSNGLSYAPDLASDLSEKEQKRAAQIVDATDRGKFIISRALLRRILSDYLETSPTSLRFQRNENGKPFLQDSPLEFNLSHSQDHLLIAVTCGHPLGIDIETHRPLPHRDAIARRWFSEAEKQFLFQSDDPDRTFFDIWSKKEAFVKARGTSIFHDLNSFTVPLGESPEEPVIEADGIWFFQSLDLSQEASAALVSKTPIRPVQRFPYRFELDKTQPTRTF